VPADGRLEADPSTTALLVVDVQNDYCHPEGALGRGGVDLGGVDAMVRGVRALQRRARDAGVLTVFVRTLHTPATHSGPWARRTALGGAICRPDTFGAEYFGPRPAESDVVVTKHRYSGFFETSLDSVLRGHRVETVVLSGTATNVCVMATAVDAVMRNYGVVVCGDATTAPPDDHETALRHVRSFVGEVRSVEEIARWWRPAPSRETADA
jgi:ureidoacrylate peracid hydrolase